MKCNLGIFSSFVVPACFENRCVGTALGSDFHIFFKCRAFSILALVIVRKNLNLSLFSVRLIRHFSRPSVAPVLTCWHCLSNPVFSYFGVGLCGAGILLQVQNYKTNTLNLCRAVGIVYTRDIKRQCFYSNCLIHFKCRLNLLSIEESVLKSCSYITFMHKHKYATQHPIYYVWGSNVSVTAVALM